MADARANIGTYPNDGQAEEILAYIEKGRPVSPFLEAILCNDLKEACSRADHVNQRLIFDIVVWLHNHAPIHCWGDLSDYEHWVKLGGLGAKAEYSDKTSSFLFIDDPYTDVEPTEEERQRCIKFFQEKLPERLTKNVRVLPVIRCTPEKDPDA